MARGVRYERRRAKENCLLGYSGDLLHSNKTALESHVSLVWFAYLKRSLNIWIERRFGTLPLDEETPVPTGAQKSF